MPAELGQHALVGGKRKEHVSSPGNNRFGLGQLIRAQVRPMAAGIRRPGTVWPVNPGAGPCLTHSFTLSRPPMVPTLPWRGGG